MILLHPFVGAHKCVFLLMRRQNVNKQTKTNTNKTETKKLTISHEMKESLCF